MEIKNAKITDVSISMEDHGCLVVNVFLQGAGWFTRLGGFANGHGYLDSDYWEGNGSAIVAMMKIMDTVGVSKWESLVGQYVRVEIPGPGLSITKIGHILKDKWFDLRTFYESASKEKPFILDERKKEDVDEE